jgi:hypothetical protein
MLNKLKFRKIFAIIFILLIILFSLGNAFGNDNLIVRLKTSSKNETYFIEKDKDSSLKIQELINIAEREGGGIIHFSSGIFTIKKPLYLAKGVSLVGEYGLTKFIVDSEYAITQNNQDIIEGILIKDITFVRGHYPNIKAVFYISGGFQKSKVENIRFLGFKDSTIFYIAPNYKGFPPRNVIFNIFENIYVDACNVCIVYSGQPYSVISENTWKNIIFEQVFQKAIEAVNWVDTEKWYNIYAMAMKSSVILIDINSKNLEHAHGFHFYSPTLVYAWNLIKENQKPTAIRLGKNTIRDIFIGVATDKKWDKFIVDDGAKSYYILMDSVEYRTRYNPPSSYIKILKKGIKEFVNEREGR